MEEYRPENKTDEALFDEFLNGEDSSFALLVDRYQNSLLGFIYKILGSRERSEEIFQETFLRVFRFRHTFKQDKTFKTWLYTISLHLCRDELKKSKKIHPPFSQVWEEESMDFWMETECPPEARLYAKELHSLLEEAVLSLSEKHREVLILYHFQNLKYEEISEVLNRKIGTIKSQLHYALQSLRTYLEPRLSAKDEV